MAETQGLKASYDGMATAMSIISKNIATAHCNTSKAEAANTWVVAMYTPQFWEQYIWAFSTALILG